MKYLTLVLFITFSLAFVKAQDDETTINSIFYNLFDPSIFKFNYDKDTLLLNSTIYKTRFEYDSISFEEETGLEVPKRIISEFRNNVEKNEIVGYWNENKLNKKYTLIYESDTIIGKKPFIHCISEDEEKILFEKTKKRQRIYSISKLLFDNNHENAVFKLMSIGCCT